jgi:hypothetical protein
LRTLSVSLDQKLPLRTAGGGFSLSAVTYLKRPTQGGLSLPPFRAADFHPKKCGIEMRSASCWAAGRISHSHPPDMRDGILENWRFCALSLLSRWVHRNLFVCLSGCLVGSPSLLRVSLSLSLTRCWSDLVTGIHQQLLSHCVSICVRVG